MAGFQMEGISDLAAQFEGIAERLDGAMERAVKKGGSIVEEELQRAVPQAATRGYSTGALEKSIKAGGVKDTGDGKEVTVSPKGSSTRNGSRVRNRDKMFYLEHGTSKQAARPFMDRALHGAEARVVSAMEEEIGKAAGS